MASARQSSIDEKEVAQFNRLAADWWDPNGPMRPLHEMNPVRLDIIADQIALHTGRNRGRRLPFEGLRVLDVGCGAGLVCEPLARLGAAVTGVDAAAQNIEVARAHATQSGLDIDYRHGAVEALEADPFDIVLALEIVEHVADLDAFLAGLRAKCSDDGLVILSTLNRTAKSFAIAIAGAEYMLRLLPRGTHDWRKFLTPEELAHALDRAGFAMKDRRGLVYHPLSRRWSTDGDMSVNYMLSAKAA